MKSKLEIAKKNGAPPSPVQTVAGVPVSRWEILGENAPLKKPIAQNGAVLERLESMMMVGLKSSLLDQKAPLNRETMDWVKANIMLLNPDDRVALLRAGIVGCGNYSPRQWGEFVRLAENIPEEKRWEVALVNDSWSLFNDAHHILVMNEMGESWEHSPIRLSRRIERLGGEIGEVTDKSLLTFGENGNLRDLFAMRAAVLRAIGNMGEPKRSEMYRIAQRKIIGQLSGKSTFAQFELLHLMGLFPYEFRFGPIMAALNVKQRGDMMVALADAAFLLKGEELGKAVIAASEYQDPSVASHAIELAPIIPESMRLRVLASGMKNGYNGRITRAFDIGKETLGNPGEIDPFAKESVEAGLGRCTGGNTGDFWFLAGQLLPLIGRLPKEMRGGLYEKASDVFIRAFLEYEKTREQAYMAIREFPAGYRAELYLAASKNEGYKASALWHYAWCWPAGRARAIFGKE